MSGRHGTEGGKELSAVITEMLRVGEDQARPARDICQALGIKPRKLTQAIEDARRSGAPICATCDGEHPGYYLAKTREDALNYCERLRHRAGEIFATRAALQRAAEALPSTGGADPEGTPEDSENDHKRRRKHREHKTTRPTTTKAQEGQKING